MKAVKSGYYEENEFLSPAKPLGKLNARNCLLCVVLLVLFISLCLASLSSCLSVIISQSVIFALSKLFSSVEESVICQSITKLVCTTTIRMSFSHYYN